MTLDLIAKTVESEGRRVPLSGKNIRYWSFYPCGRNRSAKETMINHIYTTAKGPTVPP